MRRAPLFAAFLAVGVITATLLASWLQRASAGGARSAELSYFCKLSSLNQGGGAEATRAECLSRAEPRYLVAAFGLGIALLAISAATAVRNRAHGGLPPRDGPVVA
jgi:hypothetical protein